MKLTAKTLRRALEDVAHDSTEIAIVIRDQHGNVLGFCSAGEISHGKDDFFYIEGTMLVLNPLTVNK